MKNHDLKLKKSFFGLTVFSALFFAAGGNRAGAVEVIANLQPGEWYEVPDSNMSRYLTGTSPIAKACFGVEGPKGIIDDWGGATYDFKRHRLMIMGGGHSGYGDNSVYGFNTSTLQWETVFPGGQNANGYYCSFSVNPALNLYDYPNNNATAEPYPDGSPITRHTYDGVQYVPNLDAFYVFGTSTHWRDKFPNINDSRTYSFDLTGGTWWHGNESNPDSVGGYSNTTAYDPVTGDVWTWGAAGYVMRHIPKTESWVSYGSYPMSGGVAEFDKKNRYVVGIGKLPYVTPTTYGVWAIAADTGVHGWKTVSGNAPAGSYVGLSYDDRLKRLVMWNGGTSLWALNTDAAGTAQDPWTWTEYPAIDGTDPAKLVANINGTFGRFSYMPEYNAYVLVNNWNSNVFFRKLSGDTPDVEAPSAPINLQVSGIVSTQVDLSWDISTDNIGVSGYQIYRNNQLAETVTATAYTDINLSPGTSYVYAISAVDFSGNESTKTSLSVATPPSPVTKYDLSDFINLVADWKKIISGSLADITLDGKVDIKDLGTMMSNWE